MLKDLLTMFATRSPKCFNIDARLNGLPPEVLQNSIKVGCNTRLKGVRVLPHKTELNMDFALGLNGVSV